MRSVSTQEHLVAGLAAGSVSTVLLHPLDLVKVRYQVYEGTGGPYRSVFGAFRVIISNEGIYGLYQGLSPAVFASAVSWGGYFYFYENIKSLLTANKIKPIRIPLNSSLTSHPISTRPAASPSSELNSVDHLLAGLGAGGIMVLLTNPFWLAKTRLQLQGTYQTEALVSEPVAAVTSGLAGATVLPAQRRYRGMTDAFINIIREEGICGLYKGLVPALLLTTNGAIQFSLYEEFKAVSRKIRQQHPEVYSTDQSAAESIIMGGSSKIFASFITYPYQVVKSRLQQRLRLDAKTTITDGQTVRTVLTPYKGTIDCLVTILRHEGIKGIFRGIVPHCLRVAPAASITLLVYEESLKWMRYN